MSAAVTNFIVQDVMPIYTIKKDDFCVMIEALNSRYRLPHKDYFSRTAIPELFEKTMRKQPENPGRGSLLVSYFLSLVFLLYRPPDSGSKLACKLLGWIVSRSPDPPRSTLIN